MSSSNRTINLLVVDDDLVEMQLIREIFKRAGMIINLNSVDSINQAVDFLYKQNGFETVNSPDIIYLDMHLGGAVGTELLERINNDKTISDIPVVVLTGSTYRTHIDVAAAFGAVGYILKPLNSDKILESMSLVKDIKIEFVKVEAEVN